METKKSEKVLLAEFKELIEKRKKELEAYEEILRILEEKILKE